MVSDPDYSCLKHFELGTLFEMVEDRGLILNLLSMFKEDSLRNREEIDAHIANNDFTKAFERLHTLKGSSYILGANRLGEVAKVLEVSLKACQPDPVAYQAFTHELSEIQTELTTLFNQTS